MPPAYKSTHAWPTLNDFGFSDGDTVFASESVPEDREGTGTEQSVSATEPSPTQPASSGGQSYGWFDSGRTERPGRTERTTRTSDMEPDGAPEPETTPEESQFAQIQQNLTDAMRTLAEKIGHALEDAATLHVETYVSDEITRDFKTQASLRAITRIEIDGDMQVCVPRREGDIDAELWGVHLDMVKQAQEHRAELVNSLVKAAGELLNVLKIT